MSITAAAYPIVAALVEAEKMDGMGPNRQWQARNKVQLLFLEQFFKQCRGEIGKIPEIESIASWSVEDINAFLRQRGFTIQLRHIDANTFAVASVLDLLVEWKNKGDIRTVRGIDGLDYAGVRIGKDSVEFYKASGHRHLIAALETKTGDTVYMTMVDREPADGLNLIILAEALSERMRPTFPMNSVIFPMVDLNQQVDISWLIDMATRGIDGQPAWITQALQQNILRINEVGARAKSGVAMAVTRGMTPPDLIINGPFLVWFERQHLAKPLFAGYITPEDWKNPGTL